MERKKLNEKNRCREGSADINLKSSRHSTCVKERGGWRGGRRER